MALQDDIRDLVERGHLPTAWTTADLHKMEELVENYEPSTLTTYPLNRSEPMPGMEHLRIGNHVANGQPAVFLRVGTRDGALLFSFPETNEAQNIDAAAMVGVEDEPTDLISTRPGLLDSPSPRSPTTGPEVRNQGDIAADFVNYVRGKPYRLFENTSHGPRWGASSVTGWAARLSSYAWDGKNWAGTISAINEFVDRLAMLEKGMPGPTAIADAQRIYSDILIWGNRRATPVTGDLVLRYLAPVWGGQNILEVNSTLTKLYAFAHPDDYAIYDSRVAAAILSIAEDVYRYRSIDGRRQSTINLFQNQFKHLGIYDSGAGGTRPRGYRESWPTRAYGSIEAQYEANELCKRITSALNKEKEDGRENWKLREVEAVLFMEGY
jgi:hypothetical protein